MSSYGETGLADLFVPAPTIQQPPHGSRLVQLGSGFRKLDCTENQFLLAKARQEKVNKKLQRRTCVDQEQIIPINGARMLVIPEFLSLKSKT